MIKGKIAIKLLSIITVAFVAAAVSIILLTYYQTKQIIDNSQAALYSEKLDSIMETLVGKYGRLQLTGMAKVYEEDFKKSALRALRQSHYMTANQRIYPFIAGADGSIVMHPEYPYGDKSLADTEFMKRSLNLKTGDFYYIYKNSVRKWTIFKHFRAWDWVVGYTIPIDVKYADARKLRNNLLLTITIITLLVLLVLSVIITRLTKPITDLTNISSEIAAGNLGQEINIRGTDEVGILAHSFDNMRVSVKKMLRDLEDKNKELSGEIMERKRFEESLKESEEKFSKAFHSSPDAVLISSLRDGLIIDVNDGFEGITGYSREDTIGKTSLELNLWVNPEDRNKMVSLLKTSGKVRDLKIDIRRKSGEIRSCLLSIEIINLGGKEHMIIVGRDITDQKRAEESLRLTQSSVDKSTDAVFWIRPDAHIIYVNDTVCGLLGYSRQELLTMTILDIDPDSSPEKLQMRFEEISKRGSLIFESRLRRKDGYVFPVEIMVNQWEFENKPYIFAYARDITERKKAELDLIESENKYHTLFETANDTIFIIKDDRFIDCNERTLEMFGCTRAQIIHQPPHMFSPPLQPDNRVSQEKALEKLEAAYSGAPQFFEWKHKKHDGTLFDVEVSLNAIELGSERYLQAIVRDITDRKTAEDALRKSEEQLRQAQKMEAVGQLAGGIAHDFNNVLTAIIGFANLIKMKLEEDSPLISNVDYIISSANKAAYLTQSLLAFSRKQIINPVPVKINDVIQKLNKFLMRILTADIELNLLLTEDDPTITADSVQMDQVLMNIATNARDAMPHGGILSIVTECVELDTEFIRVHGYGSRGMYAMISLIDTGIGMNEETKSRIFEPFFTTKEVGSGTGLGMSVMYGIIKQHNGFVNVYSEPGTGTTFKIYFPMIKSDVARDMTEKTKLRRGTETVLVAEDDGMARKLAKTVLEEFGYTVIEAVNGTEAAEKFMENKDNIHLLILDVIMPKKNGMQVYDEIKKVRPDIKVLFTSGYPKDIIHQRGILDKGLNFIPKPLSPQHLLLKVREVLDQ